MMYSFLTKEVHLMKTVTSREARANWRKILDEVQAAKTPIVIERYGKPIGMLVPYSAADAQKAERPMAVHEPNAPYEAISPGQEENSKRKSLLAELQSMPLETLVTAVDLLRLLRQAQRPAFAIAPIPIKQGAAWQGLLASGYEGDSLADSEALYD